MTVPSVEIKMTTASLFSPVRLYRAAAYVVWLPLALLTAGSVIDRLHQGLIYQDFAGYFALAHLGTTSGWSHFFDLGAQRQAWAWVGPTAWYPDVYPPFIAWLVAPLLLLPYPAAYMTWLVLMVGCLVGSWWLIAVQLPGRYLYLLSALALFPVGFGLWIGQVIFLEGLAVAISWTLLRHGRDVAAGAVLALILIKPQLGFLVPLTLLVGGRPRAAASFAAVAIAAGGLAVYAVTWSGAVSYVNRLDGAIANPTAWSVDRSFTLFGVVGTGALGVTVAAACVLAAAYVAWRWRSSGPGVPIAAGLVGSMLLTPFQHYQDALMLVLAAWLYTQAVRPRSPEAILLLGLGWFFADFALPLLPFEITWLVLMALRPMPSEQVAGEIAGSPMAAPARSTIVEAEAFVPS